MVLRELGREPRAEEPEKEPRFIRLVACPPTRVFERCAAGDHVEHDRRVRRVQFGEGGGVHQQIGDRGAVDRAARLEGDVHRARRRSRCVPLPACRRARAAVRPSTGSALARHLDVDAGREASRRSRVVGRARRAGSPPPPRRAVLDLGPVDRASLDLRRGDGVFLDLRRRHRVGLELLLADAVLAELVGGEGGAAAEDDEGGQPRDHGRVVEMPTGSWCEAHAHHLTPITSTAALVAVPPLPALHSRLDDERQGVARSRHRAGRACRRPSRRVPRRPASAAW